MDTKLRIKNDEPTGKSLLIQFWNGKLPTYDSEKQRGLARAATGVDAAGNPLDQNGGVGHNPLATDPNVNQATPVVDLHKMNKADLIVHAETKGVALDEDDTKATIIDKIDAATPPPVDNDHVAKGAQKFTKAEIEANKGVVRTYDFLPEKLLQEITLAAGEEKVIAITPGLFITVKEEV